MAYERFLDRETQPEPELVRKAIGREVLPVWDDVAAYLARAFPEYPPELEPREHRGPLEKYRSPAQNVYPGCYAFV